MNQLIKPLFLALCFLIQSVIVNGTPANIFVQEIKFNHAAGNSTDAIDIRKNATTDVRVPEWKTFAMPSSEPIAYKMGQTNRQIKVKFDGNCQTMNLVVSATVTSGTGIGEIVNYSIPNYQKQSEVTITLNGSLPAYVTKNNFLLGMDNSGLSS